MSYMVVRQPRPMSGLGCLCGTMGSNGDTVTSNASIFSFANLARVALVVAAGSILWTVFVRRSPMQANMLAPWADIGPLFAKSLALGPAFAFTPYL